MSLHIEQHGNPDATPIVLLHGWGLSSRVWEAWLPSLSDRYQVFCIDLPGLGRSRWPVEKPYRLDAVVEWLHSELAPRLSQPAIWLGWSLGGVVAASMARAYPEKIRGLVTLASTPCFVARDDWSCAMAAETFEAFQSSLETQPAKTLNRFAMLQGQGDPQARALLKQLKPIIAELLEQPDLKLAESLALLADDYRPLFAELTCPRLHLFAAEDALVPVAASQASLLAGHTAVLEGVGHVPFITAIDTLNNQLNPWLTKLAAEVSNG